MGDYLLHVFFDIFVANLYNSFMNSDQENFTPTQIDEFLNSMNIVFYLAVCIPLLLFIIIFLKLESHGGISPSFESHDPVWHPVLALVILLISVPGNFIYKSRLRLLGGDDSLAIKFKTFKAAAVRKYFFLFLAACLANLCLFIFEEQLYLLAFGALLIIFSINRPTVYRLKKDLPLSKGERVSLTEYRRHL